MKLLRLAGAPDSGRGMLARDLIADHGCTAWGDIQSATPGIVGLPVGQEADYRTEVLMAAQRALKPHPGDRAGWAVEPHSLIDSLAHSIASVELARAAGVTGDSFARRMMASVLIDQMLRDSRPADLTVLVPSDPGEDGTYDENVRLGVGLILRDYSIPFHLLRAPTGTPEAAQEVADLLG